MGDKWRLYTEQPSALLPHIVDYARAQDLELLSLWTLGPSLEDVFLQITGQEIGTVRHKLHEAGGKRQGTEKRRGRR